MVNFFYRNKWPTILLYLLLIFSFLGSVESSTHWVVTEDGRIQQQASSVFNLRKPYDLVMFIRQEDNHENIKAANCERKAQPISPQHFNSDQLPEQNVQKIKTEFYKTTAECVAAERRISEFPLHLSFIVSLSNKGVDVAEHINLDDLPSKQPKPPYCHTPLPFSMYAFEHLEGVTGRYQLKNLPEDGVRSALAYVKSIDDWGNKIRDSLSKNGTSWVLLNLAALYWRVQGSGLQAVECLRRALHYSPRHQRDVALMSMATVFHHGNHTLDSAVLMHASMEFTADLVTHLFHLGNMYSSMKFYELAELNYRAVLDREPNFDVARDRLNAVICEQKLNSALLANGRHETTKTSTKQKGTRSKSKESGAVDLQRNWHLADIFKKQLEDLLLQRQSSEAKFNIRTTVVSEDDSSPVQLNERQMNNLQHEIMKGIQRAKGAPFTVDVDLSKETSYVTNIRDQFQEVECRQIKRSTVVVSEKKDEALKGLQKDNRKVKKPSLSAGVRKSPGKSNIKKGQSDSAVREQVIDNKTKETGRKMNEQDPNKNMQLLRETLDRVKDVLRDAEKNLEHFEAVAKAKLANLRKVTSDSANEQTTSKSGNFSKDSRQENKNGTEYNKESRGEGKKQKPVPKQGKTTSRRRLRSGSKGDSGNMQKSITNLSGAKGGQGFDQVDNLSLEAKVQQTGLSRRRKPKGEGSALKPERRNNENDKEYSVDDDRGNGLNLDKSDSWNKVKHSRPSELKMEASSRNLNGCTTPEQSSKKGRRKGDHSFIVCSESKTDKAPTNMSPQSAIKEESADVQHDKQSITKTVEDLMDYPSVDVATVNKIHNSVSTTIDAVDISEQDTNASDSLAKNKSDTAQVDNSPNITADTVDDSLNITADRKSLNKSKLLVNESMNNVSSSEIVVTKNLPGSSNTAIVSDKTRETKLSKDALTTADGTKYASLNGKATDLPNGLAEDVDTREDRGKGNNFEDSKRKNPSIGNGKSKSKQKATNSKSSSIRKSEQINLDSNNLKKKIAREKQTKKSDKDLKNSKERKNKSGASTLQDNKREKRTSKQLVSSSEELPRELSEEECKDVHGIETLRKSHSKFSAWLSFDSKNIDLRFQVNFYEDVAKFREPLCETKIGTARYTFDHLKGVKKVSEMKLQPETGLTQTLLTLGRKLQPSVQDVGTRIYRAMQKNSTSWVLCNLAALYWRVLGKHSRAVRCLRQALYFSPPKMRDVALVGLASVLLRAGFFEDASTVIHTALQVTSEMIVGHFTLANIQAAQEDLSGAIQHYVTALELQPDFRPAMEKLKVIQCVLWQQQKELEKEAANLKKMLTVT